MSALPRETPSAPLVAPASSDAVPLCVDCDGTLLKTDLLHEAVLQLAKRAPHKLLLLPMWLWRGRAYLKQKLAQLVSFEGCKLPFNDDVVALAREARGAARRVLLVTASPRVFADQVAAQCGLFDEVMASEGDVNLAGARKAEALLQRFGAQQFDYVGNSRSDLPVWSAARSSIVVSSSAPLVRAARGLASSVHVLAATSAGPLAYAKALRLHQWLKNLLVLLPLIFAHRLLDADLLASACIAFLAFSLCASSVYVLNDMLDLDADRRHPRKCRRPFASGAIPIAHGVWMGAGLLLASVLLASQLPIAFGAVLAIYLVFTLLYSVWLKRQPVVDVMILAGLYSLRIVAGGAATGIVPSFWLLAFSMFIFLSLAIVKRYSELRHTLLTSGVSPAGRGYHVNDMPALLACGASSGMVAVLVFGLYLNNPDIHRLYVDVRWLWVVPALLQYWTARLWMKTHRGEIDDDPVVYAIRDWQSLFLLTLIGVLFLGAALWGR